MTHPRCIAESVSKIFTVVTKIVSSGYLTRIENPFYNVRDGIFTTDGGLVGRWLLALCLWVLDLALMELFDVIRPSNLNKRRPLKIMNKFYFKVLQQSLNCLLVNVVVFNLDFQLVWISTCKLYISWCKANIKRRPNPKGNMALITTMFPGPTKTQHVINKFSSKRVQDHAVSLAVSSLSILGYFWGVFSDFALF